MEAWGNLEKKEDRTTAQSLEYAVRIMETNVGTVHFAARAAILGRGISPDVAKAGGLQSQGAEGEAVVGYCDPSATPDLEPSGFPEG